MKKIIIWTLLLAMILGLCACGQNAETQQTTSTTEATTEPTTAPPTEPTTPPAMDLTGKYYLDVERNEAIVNDGGTVTMENEGNCRAYYHIFVGSFSDSNGDGVGDLRGIINRFDYLNDGDPNSGVSLGVEGIWLSPIFTSPSYHKYDTTDYYEVDPKFGTMEDLQELIDLCHARGVQIILDLVINHTGKNNAWFQKFQAAHRNGAEDDPYYNFYSWSNTTVPGVMYHTISGTRQFYEGNFSGEMPELNFDNPAVREAVLDIAKFYLDMGVDGFRFDAAKYIYYGKTTENTDFWDWYMAQLRAIKPDIFTVAEVWDSDGVTIPYFSSTNCFNFTMAQSGGMIAQTAQAGDVNILTSYVSNYLSEIQQRNPNAFMCTFIANHDTDRAAGFLTVASGQAKVAANLSLLMPGTTFIYYGEEIGMKGSRGGANTDANRRLAMFWGDGDTVKNPVGANYSSGQTNGSVMDQLPNGDSLYNHYKKLISIRKANPEIAYGTYTPLTTDSKLGGFISTYNGSSVVVLHNTSRNDVTIDLSTLTDLPLDTLVAFVGMGVATLEGTMLTISGQTSVVLR